jgi:hypothetical protein
VGRQGPFRSVTRTEHEVSVVCRDHDVPEGESVDRGWTVLEVMGPLDFSLSGVVASLVEPLAEAELPIFVISTFESDYVLVRSSDLARAADASRTPATCSPLDAPRRACYAAAMTSVRNRGPGASSVAGACAHADAPVQPVRSTRLREEPFSCPKSRLQPTS